MFKVTQLNPELHVEPKPPLPPESYALYPLPLCHTQLLSASVMIMTNLNKIKPRDKSYGNQDSISETEVSQLTGRKKTIQCQFILNNIF